MILVSEIRNAILLKLQPLKAEFNCAITKLDKENMDRPKGGNEIGILYQGRNPPSDPLFVNPAIVQLDQIDFEIYTTVTELRTNETADPILQGIRDLLTGFRPVETTLQPFYMVGREKLIGTDKGMWTYIQVFRMTHQYIQSENL